MTAGVSKDETKIGAGCGISISRRHYNDKILQVLMKDGLITPGCFKSKFQYATKG